jgi:hypothetical protein
MIRTLTALSAVAALLFLGTPALAGADPGPQPCSYTLSPPHIVQVSGTNVVTATLSPAGCGQAQSFSSAACIQLQGSDAPEQCQQNVGTATAQIYYAPYRPGATYVSTGKGCSNVGTTSMTSTTSSCQLMGPYTATL